jgi:Luciferase-like monooxygenase
MLSLPMPSAPSRSVSTCSAFLTTSTAISRPSSRGLPLAFVAAATERLVVMTNVLGVPYRSPAVTAKMAETLDRLSGGRLVLGLGSGGYDPEFSAFGLPERSPGEKVTALGRFAPVCGLSPAYPLQIRCTRDLKAGPAPCHQGHVN